MIFLGFGESRNQIIHYDDTLWYCFCAGVWNIRVMCYTQCQAKVPSTPLTYSNYHLTPQLSQTLPHIVPDFPFTLQAALYYYHYQYSVREEPEHWLYQQQQACSHAHWWKAPCPETETWTTSYYITLFTLHHCYTLLCYITLHKIKLHYMIFHHTALHYITWHYITLHLLHYIRLD